MPKHKKAESSSDSDSGPEDRNPPPSKKSAPSSSSKKKSTNNEPGEEGWLIGNNRFVNVREFRGKIMVDIREYYEKDGDLKPGKKGIALNTAQWTKFKDLIDDIDQKVSEMA